MAVKGHQCTPWNYGIRIIFSNAYVAEAVLYSDYDTLNLLIMSPCIIIFGVLTNLAFLTSVYRLKRMQTVTNYYLSVLATCDIILLLSGPLVLIIAYFKSVGRLFQFSILKNRFHCIFVFSITAISYYTSLGIVCLVSTERFYGLCVPLQHKAIAGKGRTFKLIFGALIIGLAFTIINIPCFTVFSSFCVVWPDTERFQDMPSVGVRCGPISLEYYIYQEMFTIVLFTVTFLYNICLYMKIIGALSSRSISASENLQASKVRKQVARVLILNGLVFFICQGPYRITALNRVTSAVFQWPFLSRSQADNIDIVGRVLLYLNSAINPTLYVLGSSFYRKAILETIGYGRWCRSSPTDGKSAGSAANTVSRPTVVASSTTCMPAATGCSDE